MLLVVHSPPTPGKFNPVFSSSLHTPKSSREIFGKLHRNINTRREAFWYKNVNFLLFPASNIILLHTVLRYYFSLYYSIIEKYLFDLCVLNFFPFILKIAFPSFCSLLCKCGPDYSSVGYSGYCMHFIEIYKTKVSIQIAAFPYLSNSYHLFFQTDAHKGN